MEWAILPLKKYAEFEGRSRRKEYWMFVLLLVAVMAVIAGVEAMTGLAATIGPYGPLTALFLLATLAPSLAVGARRLHDTGRSGWWLLIGYGPFLLAQVLTLAGLLQLATILSVLALAGFVVLLVFMAVEGTRGPNPYGPDSKGSDAVPAAA